jgi:hypothetical protein
VPKLRTYLLSAKVGACLARTNPAVVDILKAGEFVVCVDAQDEEALHNGAVVSPGVPRVCLLPASNLWRCWVVSV